MIPLHFERPEMTEWQRKRRLASGAMLELWLFGEAPDEVLENLLYPDSDGEFIVVFPRAADDWHAQELAHALGQNVWRSVEFKYQGVSCLGLVVYR